jgi:hypothetical protein
VTREKTPTTRDDEDAAAVLAALFAIAGTAEVPQEPNARSVWGDPAHRTERDRRPSATAWWASGMPR